MTENRSNAMSRECPKCRARPGERCISGGYPPVGELPGDPLDKPHRQRRSVAAGVGGADQ